MASSRDTSNGVDWKDLADILLRFEKENSVEVLVTITTEVKNNKQDLRLTLQPYDTKGEEVAPMPWAFVSATCSSTNRKTLEAALLALLYQLDFKLARNEFGTPKKGE